MFIFALLYEICIIVQIIYGFGKHRGHFHSAQNMVKG